MPLFKSHVVVFLIFVMACQHAVSQNIPYCQKGKWGFATTDGKITVPCVYEEVDFYSDDNLAKAKKNGKVGYINKNGVAVIPFEYDECFRIYEVYHGEHSIGIKNNPRIHLNKDFDFDDIQNNRYIVSKKNKIGILSLVEGKPKVLVPLKYSTILFDSNKKIFHCVTGSETRYFNTNGQQLTKEQVNAIEQVEFSTIGMSETYNKPEITRVNGKVGVLKRSASRTIQYDTLVPVIYDDIIMESFENGYFPGENVFGVKINNKWGMVGNKKTLLLSIDYDSINFELSKESRHWTTYQRTFVVKKDGHWGILGKKNDTSDSLITHLPFEYDAISKIYYAYLLIEKANKFQVYSVDTHTLINNKEYASITKYPYESVGGFVLFQVTNKLGQTVYLGKNGVEFFEQ